MQDVTRITATRVTRDPSRLRRDYGTFQAHRNASDYSDRLPAFIFGARR